MSLTKTPTIQPLHRSYGESTQAITNSLRSEKNLNQGQNCSDIRKSAGKLIHPFITRATPLDPRKWTTSSWLLFTVLSTYICIIIGSFLPDRIVNNTHSMIGVISDAVVGIATVYAIFIAQAWRAQFRGQQNISLSKDVMYQCSCVSSRIKNIRLCPMNIWGSSREKLLKLTENGLKENMDNLYELKIRAKIELRDHEARALDDFVAAADEFYNYVSILRITPETVMSDELLSNYNYQKPFEGPDVYGKKLENATAHVMSVFQDLYKAN